jgi:hypothetical protein
MKSGIWWKNGPNRPLVAESGEAKSVVMKNH